jgi:hypothetical protein
MIYLTGLASPPPPGDPSWVPACGSSPSMLALLAVDSITRGRTPRVPGLSPWESTHPLSRICPVFSGCFRHGPKVSRARLAHTRRPCEDIAAAGGTGLDKAATGIFDLRG